MTPPNLAEVLGRRRLEHRGSLLVYLMVDAARRRRLRSIVGACREAGVTGIELGFPFSDPIADGPVLQAAASRALRNGTHWSDLLAAIGETSDELPVAVMTYANPVFHHGLPQACQSIAAAGGSGLIVPDLALEESGPWRRAARRAALSLVQMGSPGTPPSRVRDLARSTSGFLYLVSRFGTTGQGDRAPGSELRPLVGAAHGARPELPVLVGFGIRTPADVTPAVGMGADGVIVGSAVEEILLRSPAPDRLLRFLRPLGRVIDTGAFGS
ncbi:MAG: tryptophan synthase subunit alpha [Thermoplasmata archaeon]|nr:tryptophan synthase subunit alpha [Thermoplasmata archaeon]